MIKARCLLSTSLHPFVDLRIYYSSQLMPLTVFALSIELNNHVLHLALQADDGFATRHATPSPSASNLALFPVWYAIRD